MNHSSVLPGYAELHCTSNFNFLTGASHPEELVSRASALGYAALALTDECTLAGVVRAHVEAKAQGLPFIVGSRFTLTPEPPAELPLSLILLAQSRDGYGNLAEFITLGRSREGVKKGRYRLHRCDLAAPEGDAAHLRGLPDCLAILLHDVSHDAACLTEQASWLAATFPRRAWIGLTLLHRATDVSHRHAVEAAASASGLPIVATGNVQMHVRSRKPLHDTLAAIRLGQPVAECGFDLAANAEQHLRPRSRLARLYPQAALAETRRIAALCRFSLDELRYEYPDEIVPAGETPRSYLRRETWAGAARRYPAGVPEKVSEQIEHELDLIADLAYEPYFLTVYDIVNFARGRGILCQGRGSAANSAVCYCLGITEVDPARGTLLFERFISKERNEPPDIDVDFEHQRREEVIQYIYRKYGPQRAALTAVVIHYQPRSVLRDTGRALGVDEGIIARVTASHRWWDDRAALARHLADNGLGEGSPLAQTWAALAARLMGFPRHLSQHPGGFVMARGKLSRLVPIENAAMVDRRVVQWDKDDLDALGLLKVDVLALGMLSMIRRALEFVAQRRGVPFRLQDIPAEDAATYEMIGRADTIGVFQIESRAQMLMLPRLQPKCFYDLVIEVAIVRPGPIQGDMVHPYLRRRQGLEPVSYPSEAIRAVLERTLGVPIFQEQVMQIAMVAGGFTAGEADQLRRAMATWKRRGGLTPFEAKLRSGMAQRGYTGEFAEAICRQIHGFAEYGFPESHAASFALLAYASAWLKRHEPAAFLAALLNSQPMGFYTPSQLVQDARRHGVAVLPTDITVSDWDAALEGDTATPAVRLGMNRVHGLTADAAQRIEAARRQSRFLDLADLAKRATLAPADLKALAAADALHTLAGNRRQALWQATVAAPERDMMRDAPLEEASLTLTAPSEAQSIVADFRALGLTLGRHPVALLRETLSARRFVPAATLNTYANGQFARGCGIVTVRQRPGTAKGVMFVTLEDETGPINVIVWPALVQKQRTELLTARLLGVYGLWQEERQVRHLVAKRVVDLTPLLGSLATRSRDFA